MEQKSLWLHPSINRSSLETSHDHLPHGIKRGYSLCDCDAAGHLSRCALPRTGQVHGYHVDGYGMDTLTDRGTEPASHSPFSSPHTCMSCPAPKALGRHQIMPLPFPHPLCLCPASWLPGIEGHWKSRSRWSIWESGLP